MIALFAVCVIGLTVHFALLTIRFAFPFIPVVFGGLFLLASLLGGDDHELRTVSEANSPPEKARMSAAAAFREWLLQKPEWRKPRSSANIRSSLWRLKAAGSMPPTMQHGLLREYRISVDFDPLHPKDTDLCVLAALERAGTGTEQTVKSHSLHIPLSTAAFTSARFPWVTPAATVSVKNDCITSHPQARLVDGGYVENSGIETALDLIEKLNAIKGTSDAPKFRIYLLSLVSGQFGDHGSFMFGELMEPVRALLSTITSRTYVALNHATSIDRQPDAEVTPSVQRFHDLPVSRCAPLVILVNGHYRSGSDP
ncbi:hypothetical protein [Bradyrhizobium sp. NC92]|uniref:hypothetical protein n=1 Tax=Bradyrhizobium sp. (strain NC92) TaxID=55395 RepID=UPI0021AAFBFA|nr:hypothetical protein [Bradyrhizobium sp. NC92]UWU68030.1 hypothetical protein N2602_33650 [Bradyrhizobium sp. NC92]